eukprot:11157877-Alexandrium_andersonii.AAC.1
MLLPCIDAVSRAHVQPTAMSKPMQRPPRRRREAADRACHNARCSLLPGPNCEEIGAPHDS